MTRISPYAKLRCGRVTHSVNERAALLPRGHSGRLRALKPNIQVCVAEPEALDTEVKRLSPQLVVCSRATPTVEVGTLVWVELYPGHGSISTISICGERSTVVGIELADLLSTIGRAEDLAKAS
jgi:hypothetical protein